MRNASVADFVNLAPQTGGQPAGDESHREHDDKGHQILAVVHLEGEARVNKEEIEQGHAQECREYGRTQAEHDRHEQDGEQEQHDDVRQIQIGQQGSRQQGRRGAQRDGQRVLMPGGERRETMRTAGQTGEHDSFTDKTACKETCPNCPAVKVKTV